MTVYISKKIAAVVIVLICAGFYFYQDRMNHPDKKASIIERIVGVACLLSLIFVVILMLAIVF